MDLSTFLHERRPAWKRLEELLDRAEGSGLACLNEDEAVEFGNLYRRSASDLNQAQTFVSGDATVRYLNDLVARAYLLIYGKTRIDLRGMVMFLIWGWPAVFRRYLPHFLLAAGLFAFGTVFGFLACFPWNYHDKASLEAAHNAQTFLSRPTGMLTIQPRVRKRSAGKDPTGLQGFGRLRRDSFQLPFHAQRHRDPVRLRPRRNIRNGNRLVHVRERNDPRRPVGGLVGEPESAKPGPRAIS